MNDILSALFSSTPSFASAAEALPEEHFENVHRRGEAVAAQAAFFDRLLATLVVDFTFIRIRKNFIRLRNLFKLETKINKSIIEIKYLIVLFLGKYFR